MCRWTDLNISERGTACFNFYGNFSLSSGSITPGKSFRLKQWDCQDHWPKSDDFTRKLILTNILPAESGMERRVTGGTLARAA